MSDPSGKLMKHRSMQDFEKLLGLGVQQLQ